MRNFNIPSTLQKVAGGSIWNVGGVASSFHRDLDGEAITPDAVKRAIPDFMASRGADGIQGGPLRLHHNFWDGFLKQAIQSLRMPAEEQMALIGAIALPLGRVTKIWVDDQGKTHWRGSLSQANPISKIIWGMLREGLISLGVSLGGKIFSTRQGGRDALGRPCTLIDSIRIDELSITDNPALRLTQDEDTGAYIMALSKAAGRAYSMQHNQVQRFLQKAIATSSAGLPKAGMGRSLDSGTVTGAGRSFGEPKTESPRGGRAIKMDGDQPKTGAGGQTTTTKRPTGSSANEPKTDVFGLTVKEFTRELGKACAMCKTSPKKFKAACQSGELQKMLTDGSYELAALTDSPPETLVNFVRFLQYLGRFAQELPYMDDYQATGTIVEMGDDLSKSLESFVEEMPKELMKKTFRPPGSPSIGQQDIQFPNQYIVY